MIWSKKPSHATFPLGRKFRKSLTREADKRLINTDRNRGSFPGLFLYISFSWWSGLLSVGYHNYVSGLVSMMAACTMRESHATRLFFCLAAKRSEKEDGTAGLTAAALTGTGRTWPASPAARLPAIPALSGSSWYRDTSSLRYQLRQGYQLSQVPAHTGIPAHLGSSSYRDTSSLR
jgi:hypothetical protein